MNFFLKKINSLLVKIIKNNFSVFKDDILNIIKNEPSLVEHFSNKLQNTVKIWGEVERVHISPTACMVNTQFNTSSGDIYIGEYTFTGHNVSIITGCHDFHKTCLARQQAYPLIGNDIKIGNGVWLASNCTILGPCSIGDNAVIAAGAIVTPGTIVPPNTIYGGIPAKELKQIITE